MAIISNLTGTMQSTFKIAGSKITVSNGILSVSSDTIVLNETLSTVSKSDSVSETWTPDSAKNVFDLTVSGNTIIGNIDNKGYAGEWTIFIRQDSSGGHTVSFDPNIYSVHESKSVSTDANAVTLCKLYFSGLTGDKIDVVISVR